MLQIEHKKNNNNKTESGRVEGLNKGYPYFKSSALKPLGYSTST